MTNIIDGGSAADGNVAQWQGPFNPGELADLYDAYFIDVTYSQPLQATVAIVNSLKESDPTWWAASFGQIIDGGNASAGPYANVIDGGNS